MPMSRSGGSFRIHIFAIIVAVFFLVMNHANISFADDQSSKQSPTPKVVSSDTNHDGKPDQWQYYENGEIVRTEADTNFDGKVDEIGYFKNGKLVRVEKDSDYDGKMDKWVDY